MPNFIDRRLNPKDKSLSNRQRFLRRARVELKRVINEKISTEKITDVDAGHAISLPVSGTSEPSFSPDRGTGRREYVLPGNREFVLGDRLPKPGAGGGAGAGKGGAADIELEDDFRFVLSREEVLDLFFEDLELPDMVKSSLKEAIAFQPRRAGFTTAGAPRLPDACIGADALRVAARFKNSCLSQLTSGSRVLSETERDRRDARSRGGGRRCLQT